MISQQERYKRIVDFYETMRELGSRDEFIQLYRESPTLDIIRTHERIQMGGLCHEDIRDEAIRGRLSLAELSMRENNEK